MNRASYLYVYNSTPLRSNVFDKFKRDYLNDSYAHVEYLISYKSSNGLLNKLKAAAISPFHLSWICFKHKFSRKLPSPHFILFTQPPLMQPLLGAIIQFSEYTYESFVYDNYFPVISEFLSRYILFRPLLRMLKNLLKSYYLHATRVTTLSISMKKLLAKDFCITESGIYIDEIHSHNKNMLEILTSSSTLSRNTCYDLIYLGSFSFVHTFSGLGALILRAQTPLKILISRKAYTCLINSVELVFDVRPDLLKGSSIEDKMSYIEPIDYLSESQLANVLSKSSFGFASLQNRFSGVCYPSKILTYLYSKVPVIYDGLSGDLDHLLHAKGVGFTINLQNLSLRDIDYALEVIKSSTKREECASHLESFLTSSF